MKRWTADAVSLSRLALLAPLAWCLKTGSLAALPILAAIVATDLLDGPIARRLATAGSTGACIDAACDALVVMTAAIILGLDDARYAWFAGLIAAAFLSYGARSLLMRRFAYTRLGRYNGAACYVVVLVASARSLPGSLGTAVSALQWVVLCLAACLLAVSAAENVAGIPGSRPNTRRRDQWITGSS